MEGDSVTEVNFKDDFIVNASAVEEGGRSSNEKDSKDCKEEKKAVSTVQFHKLFTFADSKDVFLMIIGTIGAVTNGASMPLMTVLFGNLTNAFGQTTNIHDVVHEVSKVAIKFLYLAIASGIASFLQVSCWMATGERQAARIRNLYLKTILRQEISFFDKETNTGEVVGRMSGDTVLIQDAIGEKVGKVIQLISTFFGSFVVAFIKGWLLTLVMLSMLPPLVISGGIVASVVANMASKGQAAYADTATVVEQTVGAIRTVASFTGEKLSVKTYAKSTKRAYNTSLQEGLATGFIFGAAMFVVFSGFALGIWYGGKLILDKGYTGGDVISVIFALLTGSSSLGETSPCLTAFAAGQAAAYKMFETISRKPEIDAYDSRGKVLDDICGNIEFRDVYFSYPTRPDEQILNGLSLYICNGTTIALVGQSGSGKSTVVSLIERFYDPQAGEILIDGLNLKELQLRWIRGKIGLVSQEPVLFASSIKDNIAYGKEDATNEEIREAIELANASKFVDKLPQGLDTMVGEHGTQLSGGQKQRVAIARAILKDPRILLLDEATSSLDVESERIVQEALDRIMTNRTTVIVAHRLTTVKDSDAIAVIHQGTIVEQGSHYELIKDPDGVYSQLIRLQDMSNDPDQEKSEGLVEDRQLSQESSLCNHNQDSFSTSLGLSVGVEIQGSTSKQLDTKKQYEKEKHVPLRRLAYLNKPEIPELLLGSFAAIINGCIVPAFGLLLSNAINTYYQPPHKLRKDSRMWSLIYLIFAVVSLVALPIRTYFFGMAGAKLIRRVRLMTFEKVVNMEIAWFDHTENSSGAIGARLSADAATIKGLVGDALALVVENTTTLVAGFVIAFTANWQLSLIILALIPLLGLNGYAQIKFIKGFSTDAKVMYGEASQIANDAVGSIRTVASFSAEEKVIELYKRKCEGPIRKGIKQGIISGVGYGVSFFFLFGFYALSFYIGARFVEDGKTTFGKVFRVFFALGMTAMGISQSSSLAPNSSKASSAAASIFNILDRKSRIDPSDDSGMVLNTLKGDIEFQNVSFCYPSRPNVQVFQDFTLAIQSGKTVALVGESGSGKSTVISLLQRFYDPDSGHILLDEIDLQKFQLRWLRQQMGLVSQEPVLFNDTIRANIAYGKEGKATEAEIVAAAQLANADKFVCGLQQGYDTIVGERGIQLSGGQKQRIAIARAIVKDPKILLLDEATSALDAESEKTVQDALDQVMVNRTTLVVAHRLSTIKHADLISVVKNGAIIEKGKHESLINIKDGAYAFLVSLYSSPTQ